MDVKDSNDFENFCGKYLGVIESRFTFFKSEDILKLVKIANLEQKIEITTFAILAALGGKKLIFNEGLALRKSVRLPYIIYNSQVNYYLLTILGDIILYFLSIKGHKLALEYIDLLGGKSVLQGSKLNRMSRQRRAFVKYASNMYRVSYKDQVEIYEILSNLILEPIKIETIYKHSETKLSESIRDIVYKDGLVLQDIINYNLNIKTKDIKTNEDKVNTLDMNSYLTLGSREQDVKIRSNINFISLNRKDSELIDKAEEKNIDLFKESKKDTRRRKKKEN